MRKTRIALLTGAVLAVLVVCLAVSCLVRIARAATCFEFLYHPVKSAMTNMSVEELNSLDRKAIIKLVEPDGRYLKLDKSGDLVDYWGKPVVIEVQHGQGFVAVTVGIVGPQWGLPVDQSAIVDEDFTGRSLR